MIKINSEQELIQLINHEMVIKPGEEIEIRLKDFNPEDIYPLIENLNNSIYKDQITLIGITADPSSRFDQTQNDNITKDIEFNFPRLKYLSLENFYFQNTTLDLRKLKDLESFYCEKSRLTKAPLLDGLDSLALINLASNQLVSWPMLRLEKLQMLILYNNKLSYPPVLKHCPMLSQCGSSSLTSNLLITPPEVDNLNRLSTQLTKPINPHNFFALPFKTDSISLLVKDSDYCEENIILRYMKWHYKDDSAHNAQLQLTLRALKSDNPNHLRKKQDDLELYLTECFKGFINKLAQPESSQIREQYHAYLASLTVFNSSRESDEVKFKELEEDKMRMPIDTVLRTILYKNVGPLNEPLREVEAFCRLVQSKLQEFFTAPDFEKDYLQRRLKVHKDEFKKAIRSCPPAINREERLGFRS